MEGGWGALDRHKRALPVPEAQVRRGFRGHPPPESSKTAFRVFSRHSDTKLFQSERDFSNLKGLLAKRNLSDKKFITAEYRKLPLISPHRLLDPRL